MALVTSKFSWLKTMANEHDVGLFHVDKNYEFTVSTDSFLLLCRCTYEAISSTSSNIKEMLSESMFIYYNVIHLWQRIALIRFHSKIATEEEVHFIMYLKSMNSMILEPISCYLDKIGNFEDASGTRYILKLPYLPKPNLVEGVTGYFGKVTSETHAIYEAFPAPGVCAQRMIEDYNVTISDKCLNDEDLIWDLPKALRPDYKKEDYGNVLSSGPLPTRNLLGWAPATRLTNTQLKLIESAIKEDSFKVDYFKRFCFNESIFKHISIIFSNIQIMYECNLHTHGPEGSPIQALFLTNARKEVIFQRNSYYCEDDVKAVSAQKYDVDKSIMARIFGYRIKKEDINGLSSWSCYDFNEYKNVPQSWKQSRNRIFNFGNAKALNNECWFTVYVNKHFITSQFVKAIKYY